MCDLPFNLVTLAVGDYERFAEFLRHRGGRCFHNLRLSVEGQMVLNCQARLRGDCQRQCRERHDGYAPYGVIHHLWS